MRIGKYTITLGKTYNLIFPIIVLSFVGAYLFQSYEIFSALSMILIRITFYAILVFTVFVLREEIKINKVKNESFAKRKKYKIKESTKRILLFIIFTGVYIVMINKLGFSFSTLVYSGIMMYRLGIRSAKQLIFIPIFLVIIIYLMFSKWLMVPLPLGFLGF